MVTFWTYVFAGTKYSFAEVLMFLVLFAISSLMLFAVTSHYVVLRRVKGLGPDVISTVFDSKSNGQHLGG